MKSIYSSREEMLQYKPVSEDIGNYCKVEGVGFFYVDETLSFRWYGERPPRKPK